MTARQIASHRYGHPPEAYSSSAANHELLAEYKNLLLEVHARNLYERYLRLLCQLLQCERAVFLLSIDDAGQEVACYQNGGMCDKNSTSFGKSFLKSFRESKLAHVDDIDLHHISEETFWRRSCPTLRSYAISPIVIGELELGLLVVSNRKPFEWLPEKLENLRDVSQMLCADLEMTRERHLIAVQKRMQRSLVRCPRV